MYSISKSLPLIQPRHATDPDQGECTADGYLIEDYWPKTEWYTENACPYGRCYMAGIWGSFLSEKAWKRTVWGTLFRCLFALHTMEQVPFPCLNIPNCPSCQVLLSRSLLVEQWIYNILKTHLLALVVLWLTRSEIPILSWTIVIVKLSGWKPR